jgi:hypothetical protein
VECKKFGFVILGEIPYNYICDLLKREGDLFLQQECHYTYESREREEGRLGANYVQ